MTRSALERVRPSVWTLRMPWGTGEPTTNASLILDPVGGCTVVDPGVDSPANRARLTRALAAIGSSVRGVRTVAVTHLHPDHLGLAPWLAAASGARLLLHPLDIADLRSGSADTRYAVVGDRGVPDSELPRLHVDAQPAVRNGAVSAVPLRAGAIASSARSEIRALHTPGHTRGHVCFVLPTARLLLVGDHLLPHSNPGIGLGGTGPASPISAYLDSLARLAPFDSFEAVPGHGPLLARIATRRRAAEGHVLARASAVAAACASLGPAASTWSIASTLTWSGGFDQLSGFRLRSALRQTDLYREFLLDETAGALLDTRSLG